MKKQIKFTGLVFFLSFASLHAQMSYYYEGKKINLTVDRNYVYIIAEENFFNSESTNQMLQSLNLESEENKMVDGMTKLKFKSAPEMKEYTKRVEILKQNEQIKYVFPFFERAGIAPIGTSDVFYIKLKNEKDIETLREVTERQNLQIIKQIPYMSLWYILSIKKSVFSNSIEATNYLFETGMFEDVDPAFMFEFKSNCTNDPMFNQLWGLRNTTSTTNVGINICNAWNYSRGAGVERWQWWMME